jgi:hypothetical protein
MVIWVDMSLSHVLDTNLVQILEIGSFHSSDARLQFSTKQQSFITQYAINRYTGLLSATITDKGRTVGSLSGRCSRSESAERKF